jgi:hypothetical protein
VSNPICDKHGAGFGDPCYMCVDETNRELTRRCAEEREAGYLQGVREAEQKPLDRAREQHAALTRRCAELEAALRDYGVHDDDCPYGTGDGDCTCGLNALTGDPAAIADAVLKGDRP